MIDLIVNPVSGKGAGSKALQVIEEYLKSQFKEYKVHLLTKSGEGQSVAAKLCKEGAKTIAVIGGDGTFHEVLNGMDFSKARLGLIPAGRGNDYAESAGLPFDPVEAVNKVLSGDPEE